LALNLETTERLFGLGEFEDIRRGTDFSDAGLRSLECNQQLLIAHALALSGHLAESRRVAGLWSADSLPPNLRCRAEIVHGVIAEGSGAMSEALEHFQLALRIARAAKDDIQTAWSQLRIFRHLIDRSATNISAAMFSEVRRAAIRAATPHVTAYLHQCVSVLEGQSGQLDESRRHCDIVDSLLTSSPNAWLRVGNLVNRACLALLNCNYSEAAGYLARAKSDNARSGTRSSAIDNNLAHCQLMTGQFEKAAISLRRVVTSERTSHLALLGALEELARLHLATGRMDECEEALQRLDAELARDATLHLSFHLRWAAITKARFLLRSGRVEAALSHLESTEARLSQVNDAQLRAAIHLAFAQTHATAGDLTEAAVRLAAASTGGITKFKELQAGYYSVASKVIGSSSAPLAAQLRRRAKTLWKQQGTTLIPLELNGTLNEEAHRDGGIENSDESAAAPCALDSVAAIFELANDPELMATELLGLIDTVTKSPATIISESKLTGRRAKGDEIVISLGSASDSLTVLCPLPPDTKRAMALLAIAKIAEAAQALEKSRATDRSRAALWPPQEAKGQSGAVFIADEMQALLATARRVATTNVPVLITGETGTGKEILARTIHACSNRSKAAFLPFNCTSTPKDMLDSQLFGHRRGSFTGATDNFQGVIRAAAGGTLFLDEIGDMGLDVQPKLLRFLESGEVHPVGDAHPHQVDVRVIAATNANLDALVTDGRFREDLFYRLNIVPLHLPPLRERRVEIPAFANHYLQKYAQEFGKGDLRLAEETMEYLLLFRWPGNVRQLANEMRRMAALCEAGAVLMPEHLSPDIAASRRTIPASDRVLDQNEVVVRLDQPLAAATEHLERAMLEYALKQCGGRMEETAALLGLSRKGLYLKRQRFGIEPPDPGARAFDVA
jgi:DNA-binding NtrC family response regulator/tetratricopeptide (TPR) repeat protein